MHKHAIHLEMRMRAFEKQAQNLYNQLKATTSGPSITADRLKYLSVAELTTWLNGQDTPETRKITIPST